MEEATSEGLVFIQAQGQILDFNLAFRKMFGYEDDAITALPLQQFIPDWEQEAKQYETLGKHKNGKDFFIEINKKEVSTDGHSFWALGIRDISRPKQAPTTAKPSPLDEARKVMELSQALKKKNKDLQTSLYYAQRIQEALLPEPSHLQSVLPEIFVYYKPREIVSGDFYWWGVEGQRVVLAAVDATGHGVPGAIMTLAGTLFFNQIVHLQKTTAPDEILTQLHLNIFTALKQEESQNREGMDASLCTIDFQQGHVEFAGAKNGLLYFQNGQCLEEPGDALSAGGFWSRNEGHRLFHKKKIPFGTGKSMFYLFTDGYEDQFGGPRGRKFMKQNLRDLFQEIHTEPMEEQQAILASTMEVWMKGHRQIDDMLVLGFRL
ncbi:MAG: SpoIIE family protein phosphatase [Microscillaceae bacterium]|nr:SpoIIE family protein phosphatase [Microscillaceae bacterium]